MTHSGMNDALSSRARIHFLGSVAVVCVCVCEMCVCVRSYGVCQGYAKRLPGWQRALPSLAEGEGGHGSVAE